MKRLLLTMLLGTLLVGYLGLVYYNLRITTSIKPISSNVVINIKKLTAPTPTPTITIQLLPKATSMPTIDCVGPDGKHTQATQKDCDNLNSFWKSKITPTQTPSNNSNTQNPAPTITPYPTIIPTISILTPTPTTSSTPTIRVTYPNGGETFTEGDNITITWEATNGPFTMFGVNYTDCPSCAGGIGNADGSARSINWKVNVGNTGQTQFKVRIITFPTYYSPNPVDDSDANFTVIQNPACDSGCP